MNKTLLIGILITAVMLVVALFGPMLAPYDSNHQVKITYTIDEHGNGKLFVPPVPPSAEYPLGTDKYGYDLLTKLMYGAKYSILLSIGIAIARVFIGGLIGMVLGYYAKNKANQQEKESHWSMLNGIPTLIIVWLIMIGVSINPSASTFMMSIVLAIILIVIGVPSVASTVKAKTIIIREKQFVTASQSLGAGSWTIIRSHLFVHLKESYLILIVQEIILTLAIFGQLAIFHIFVGGTTMYTDPVSYHSRTNEWGGLIGQLRMNFYVDQWMFYVPLTFYVLLIVGFHLLSKGLEKRYSQMFSKFPQL